MNQLGFIDPNKNCKYIVCSRKLLYSNEMEELFKVIGTQNMDFLLNNFIVRIRPISDPRQGWPEFKLHLNMWGTHHDSLA